MVLVIGNLTRVIKKDNQTASLGLVVKESSGFEWTVDKPPGNHISRIPSSHIPTTTVTTPTIPEGAVANTCGLTVTVFFKKILLSVVKGLFHGGGLEGKLFPQVWQKTDPLLVY